MTGRSESRRILPTGATDRATAPSFAVEQRLFSHQPIPSTQQ